MRDEDPITEREALDLWRDMCTEYLEMLDKPGTVYDKTKLLIKIFERHLLINWTIEEDSSEFNQ